MPRERLFASASEAETESLGESIGARLRAGDVIDLRGELGAGKTCFVRGLASGLGVSEAVRSPTFTIAHVHRGRTLLFHLDAYRVEHPEELLEQGLDEMPARGAIAVEWGGRIERLLPDDRLVVEIETGSAPGARLIRLRALGEAAERLLGEPEETPAPRTRGRRPARARERNRAEPGRSGDETTGRRTETGTGTGSGTEETT